MSADGLREGVAQVDPLAAADDVPGLVLGLAAWLAVLVLAPVVALVLPVVSGSEQRETYRNGLRARRRILEVNADRRVPVRWAWT